MITCRALGPPELTVDAAPPPPEMLWRKNLALLVYLGGSPEGVRSREHLIGLLWGGKPDRTARHSLREAVRVLRRAGGQQLIEAEAETLRLNSAMIAFDTDDFDARARAGDWSGAVMLVRGEYLEGLSIPDAQPFEDWLHSERLSWRHRSVDALTNLGSEALSTGDLHSAWSLGVRAITLDPVSDRAIRLVMQAAALADDRAGALARYERFVHHLDDTSGAPPAVETRELAERIRSERVWQLPAYVVQAGSRGAESRRAPLVGRREELRILLGALETAQHDGHAGLGIIRAGDGVGKTRLANEVLARARLDGVVVATFRAVPADEAGTLSGLIGLARGGLVEAPGVAASQSGALAALAGRMPEWADRFPAIRHAGDPWTLPDAFDDVVRVVAEEQPVLLVVDDVQWLDTESLLALEAVSRDRSNLPLFVLLACGEESLRADVEEVLARFGRDGRGTTVALEPLTVSDVTELAAWAFPHYSEDEQQRVARRVWADSAGLPLLAVELFHAISLGLEPAGAAGAWPKPQKTLDQTLPGELPEAVVAAIRVGFRRLTADAQVVLGAAAVLEERVAAGAIERATGFSRDRVETALDELEWQRWLAADREGYTFVARIVRRVVDQDMIPAGRRRRILDAAGAGS